MNKFFLFVLICIPLVANAEVYKWVDKNGKVHYGDNPTAGLPSVEVNIDHSQLPADSGDVDEELSREEKRERLLESMEEERFEKEEQRKKQAEKKKRDRKKCIYYKDRMRNFKRANALYKLDKDGNRVYMSDSQRQKSTRNLQKKINRYCT